MGVGGGRHGAVSERVGVLVVLREPDPPDAGVQNHRGPALAQRPIAGRPSLQRQGADSAHPHAAQRQVVVQREVVQTVGVQLGGKWKRSNLEMRTEPERRGEEPDSQRCPGPSGCSSYTSDTYDGPAATDPRSSYGTDV